jgi:hypothetical protein
MSTLAISNHIKTEGLFLAGCDKRKTGQLVEKLTGN